MLRIALVGACVALATGAFAQKNEAEVRAVYSRMNVMMAKRDAKGLIALFEKTATPGFVAVRGQHKIGRARFAADLKEGLSMKDAPKAVSKVLSAKKVGKTLVLEIQWMFDLKRADGKPFAMKMLSTNTWVSTPNGYRLKRIDERPS